MVFVQKIFCVQIIGLVVDNLNSKGLVQLFQQGGIAVNLDRTGFWIDDDFGNMSGQGCPLYRG